MLIKSFFKDKKIFKCLVIFFISLSILTSLFILKRYYINKINNFYNEALINFRVNSNLYDNIKSISNIKELYVSINGNYKTDTVNLLANKYANKLKNNEIIVSRSIFQNIKINDVLIINCNDEDYEFVVKDIINDSIYDNFVYISYDYFQTIENNHNEIWMYATLNNYLKYKQTINELQNLDGFNASVDKIQYNKIDFVDYEFYLAIINIIIFFYYFIFGIVLYYILYSISNYYKNTNYLYKCIGFNNRQIMIINGIEILLFLIIPILINFFFYFIKL